MEGKYMLMRNYKMKIVVALFAVPFIILSIVLTAVRADATLLTINSDPGSLSFYIPLKASTSGSYLGGYGHTSDTVTLASGGTSSGWLSFSLMYSPIPDDPINTADLKISFSDLDLLPY